MEKSDNQLMDELDNYEVELRKNIIKTAWWGKGGHITSALSMVDILVVLFWGGILRFNPSNPKWEERDRFILSKAHGALGYYVLLAMLGYFNMDDLKKYCQPGQNLGDIANARVVGVENSGGSLGHGLGFAAGKALSAKLKKEKYLTYVITGDGECQEGSIWESALFIGNTNLNNLIWIIDYNHLQALGYVDDISSLEPLSMKLEAFGFDVRYVDGHDKKQLIGALYVDRDNLPQKPIAVIADTVKGHGVPFFAGKEGWHGRTPTDEEYTQIMTELGIKEEELY